MWNDKESKDNSSNQGQVAVETWHLNEEHCMHNSFESAAKCLEEF